MATDRNMLTAVVFITMGVAMVTSFPSGAPNSACASLIPDTHGPSTAAGASPYTVTLSSTTYSPNEVITVQLGGASFKGFLIVARQEGSTVPVGTFQTPPSGSKITCTATPGNGVTHTTRAVKSSVTLEYQAPSTSVGPITFHYTVVRGGAPSSLPDFSDYFAGLVSASITPAEAQQEKSIKSQSFEEIIAKSKPFSNA